MTMGCDMSLSGYNYIEPILSSIISQDHPSGKKSFYGIAIYYSLFSSIFHGAQFSPLPLDINNITLISYLERIMQWVHLFFPHQHFAIKNILLLSLYLPPGLLDSVDAANALLNAIKNEVLTKINSYPGSVIIIGGDFNMDPEQSNNNQLRARAKRIIDELLILIPSHPLTLLSSSSSTRFPSLSLFTHQRPSNIDHFITSTILLHPPQNNSKDVKDDTSSNFSIISLDTSSITSNEGRPSDHYAILLKISFPCVTSLPAHQSSFPVHDPSDSSEEILQQINYRRISDPSFAQLLRIRIRSMDVIAIATMILAVNSNQLIISSSIDPSDVIQQSIDVLFTDFMNRLVDIIRDCVGVNYRARITIANSFPSLLFLGRDAPALYRRRRTAALSLQQAYSIHSNGNRQTRTDTESRITAASNELNNVRRMIIESFNRKKSILLNEMIEKIQQNLPSPSHLPPSSVSIELWKLVQKILVLDSVHQSDPVTETTVENAKDYFNNLLNGGAQLESKDFDQDFTTVVEKYFIDCIYPKFFDDSPSAYSDQPSSIIPLLSSLNNDITISEIESSIKCLRKGTAIGSDRVPVELFIETREEISPIIHSLFFIWWFTGIVPSGLFNLIIRPLFKKGDRSHFSNYRPVAVAPAISKILEYVLLHRLLPVADQLQWFHSCQAGFRTNRSITENIFILSSVISARNAQSLPTFLAFLDIKSAYDAVWRKGMLFRLWQLGIRGRFFRLLYRIYSRTTARISSADRSILSETFNIAVGVIQGGVISPHLFTIYLNPLLDALSQQPGCRIYLHASFTVSDYSIIRDFEFSIVQKSLYEGVRDFLSFFICVLAFADDIVIFAETILQLNALLATAKKIGKEWRFRFSPGAQKSAIMIYHPNPSIVAGASIVNLFRLGDDILPIVSSYRYLGALITAPFNWSSDLSATTQSAEKAFNYLYSKGLFTRVSQKISLSYASRLYTSLIQPKLIRSAEVVALPPSHSLLKSLIELQHVHARKLLRLPPSYPKSLLCLVLNWYPIEYARLYHTLLFFLRIISTPIEERLKNNLYKSYRSLQFIYDRLNQNYPPHMTDQEKKDFIHYATINYFAASGIDAASSSSSSHGTNDWRTQPAFLWIETVDRGLELLHLPDRHHYRSNNTSYASLKATLRTALIRMIQRQLIVEAAITNDLLKPFAEKIDQGKMQLPYKIYYLNISSNHQNHYDIYLLFYLFRSRQLFRSNSPCPVCRVFFVSTDSSPPSQSVLHFIFQCIALEEYRKELNDLLSSSIPNLFQDYRDHSLASHRSFYWELKILLMGRSWDLCGLLLFGLIPIGMDIIVLSSEKYDALLSVLSENVPFILYKMWKQYDELLNAQPHRMANDFLLQLSSSSSMATDNSTNNDNDYIPNPLSFLPSPDESFDELQENLMIELADHPIDQIPDDLLPDRDALLDIIDEENQSEWMI